MSKIKRLMTVGPAIAMTAVSMILTGAVVVLWLGTVMPWWIAAFVGLGLDGGWLAVLAYERRLSAQGDHNAVVTGFGWGFGAVATAVLIVHALNDPAPAAWLAVAWLPLAAKALWLVHSLWEATALTPEALKEIRTVRQEARDDAAVARARLRAGAGTEETRLDAVTEAGARVALVQAKTAERLSAAWTALEKARQGEGTARALACVTTSVASASQPRWELPVWGPVESLPWSEPVNTPVNGWTPEIVEGTGLRDDIVRLAAGGMAQREIARQLGCAPSYVNKTVNTPVNI